MRETAVLKVSLVKLDPEAELASTDGDGVAANYYGANGAAPGVAHVDNYQAKYSLLRGASVLFVASVALDKDNRAMKPFRSAW